MPSWSDLEQNTIVEEYFAMLEQELAGQAYKKSEHNKRVQDRTSRSKGSVEYKFSNVSAALRDLHAPYIDGYKPYANYQASLCRTVESFLQSRPQLLELMRRSVESPAAARGDVQWRVIPPPADAVFPAGRSGASFHTDFVALEAANSSLGLHGEELVLRRERELLRHAGCGDLAQRVEHVSLTLGDGFGYDIASFSPNGAPRLIEVKTTRRAQHWPMFVSRNEVRVSREKAEHFVLARVFHFASSKVGLFELPGAIEDSCVLEPDSYRALPRPSAASKG